MMSLLKYEFRKNGKSMLWAAFMMMFIGGVFLSMAYASGERMDWDSPVLPQMLSSISVVALGILASIAYSAPTIASAVLFNQDLNEPRAIFEAHIPQPGWKRVLAKYVVYFGFILSGVIMSAGLVYLSFQMLRNAAPTEIQFDFDRITAVFNQKRDFMPELIRIVFGSALTLTLGTMFFNFFSTVHSVIRHKIKSAASLTIFLAVSTGIGSSWLYDRLFAVEYGLFTDRLLGIQPGLIFQLSYFLLGFLAVSWMLDHKTEVK